MDADTWVEVSHRLYGRSDYRVRFDVHARRCDPSDDAYIECRVLPRGWFVELVYVERQWRGLGWSKHLLRAMCAAADQDGMVMKLEAAQLDERGPGVASLCQLYGRFGFVRNDQPFGYTMWREPNAPVLYNGYTSVIDRRDTCVQSSSPSAAARLLAKFLR